MIKIKNVNDIIELAKKHNLSYKEARVKNAVNSKGITLYEYKEDTSVSVTLNDLKELIQENHKEVTSRLDGIDARFDNLVEKNNLVE